MQREKFGTNPVVKGQPREFFATLCCLRVFALKKSRGFRACLSKNGFPTERSPVPCCEQLPFPQALQPIRNESQP